MWMCVNAYPHHRLKWEEDWDRLDVREFEYYEVYVGGKVEIFQENDMVCEG